MSESFIYEKVMKFSYINFSYMKCPCINLFNISIYHIKSSNSIYENFVY